MQHPKCTAMSWWSMNFIQCSIMQVQHMSAIQYLRLTPIKDLSKLLPLGTFVNMVSNMTP